MTTPTASLPAETSREQASLIEIMREPLNERLLRSLESFAKTIVIYGFYPRRDRRVDPPLALDHAREKGSADHPF